MEDTKTYSAIKRQKKTEKNYSIRHKPFQGQIRALFDLMNKMSKSFFLLETFITPFDFGLDKI